MKPTKYPTTTKNEARKAKQKGGEKAKSKSLKILLSVHA